MSVPGLPEANPEVLRAVEDRTDLPQDAPPLGGTVEKALLPNPAFWNLSREETRQGMPAPDLFIGEVHPLPCKYDSSPQGFKRVFGTCRYIILDSRYPFPIFVNPMAFGLDYQSDSEELDL
jgi:hypothetical protein